MVEGPDREYDETAAIFEARANVDFGKSFGVSWLDETATRAL
jgi:hypothetical protein